MKPESRFLKFNLMPNKIARWIIFSLAMLITVLGIGDMFALTLIAFDNVTGLHDLAVPQGVPYYWITKAIFRFVLFLTVLVYGICVALTGQNDKARKISRIIYYVIIGELVVITLAENICSWFNESEGATASLGGFFFYHVILALLIASIVLLKLNPDKNSKKNFNGKICFFSAVIILSILLVYNLSNSFNFKKFNIREGNQFITQFCLELFVMLFLIAIIIIQSLHVFISKEDEDAENAIIKQRKDEYNAYLAKLEAERRQAIANAQVNYVTHANNSIKKRSTAFRWCFFLGIFGAHRFYVGKIGTGILYIFTLGFFTFGATFDLLSILFESFRDKKGYVVRDEDL